MIRVVDSQIRPGKLWHVYDDSNWLGAIDSVFSPIGKFQIAIGGGPRSNELYDSREDAYEALLTKLVAEKLEAT